MDKGFEIKKHSGVFTLYSTQIINTSMKNVWDYFSNPENLNQMTPAEMRFRITSGPSKTMYAGMIISYKVKLLPMIHTNWVTEITHVEPLKYFIDVQLFGPYTLWHHQHHFEEQEGGVLMTDTVTFKIPLGIFGRIASPFVKKKLSRIFAFRKAFIEKMFNLKYSIN
jgi:ligand-binding SRPBCC domain-containing protein